jgi:hypothetical protein
MVSTLQGRIHLTRRPREAKHYKLSDYWRSQTPLGASDGSCRMTSRAVGCPGYAMFVCSLQPPAQPHESTQPHKFPDSKSVPGLQERKNSHHKLNTLSHSTSASCTVDILTIWSQLRSDRSPSSATHHAYLEQPTTPYLDIDPSNHWDKANRSLAPSFFRTPAFFTPRLRLHSVSTVAPGPSGAAGVSDRTDIPVGLKGRHI